MSLNPLEEEAKIGLELKEMYLKGDAERQEEEQGEGMLGWQSRPDDLDGERAGSRIGWEEPVRAGQF